MVKRFQIFSQVSFPLIDFDMGYLYIILIVKTADRELNLKNAFCTLCLWSWVSCKACLLC